MIDLKGRNEYILLDIVLQSIYASQEKNRQADQIGKSSLPDFPSYPPQNECRVH